MTAPGNDFYGYAQQDITGEVVFSEWRKWPEMTGSDGRDWVAPQMSRELATANRRAATYQLVTLAHMSSSPAWAARYSLLAQVAYRCTDGPLWLRSTKIELTLAELLYPKLSEHERAAFDAFTESIQEAARANA